MYILLEKNHLLYLYTDNFLYLQLLNKKYILNNSKTNYNGFKSLLKSGQNIL